MASVWWRIGWRNLWRNRHRTLITAGALAFGYLGSVLMIGVSDGITAEMIDNGTGLLTGQVQVTGRGYRPDRSLYATIGGDSGTDVPALLDRITAVPGVEAAAPRVYGGGLIAAGQETAGVLLMGVEPARERRVSLVLGTVVAGRVPAAGARELAVGSELARRLGVKPGAEVVLVAPAADGTIGNDLFTVAGVLQTGLPELDAAYAVLPLHVLQQLLALDSSRVHEVAVAVPDPQQATAVSQALDTALGAVLPHAVIEPWPVFRPELASYADMAAASNGLIVAIVFLMAVFGVANTMLMGTWERRREFAVVRALGAAPRGVAETVIVEGFLLGGLALLAGAALTAPVMVWWHRAPPDLSRVIGDFTMAGAVLRPVLRVEYSAWAAVGAAAALLVTAIAAAAYPAIRAARVPPADALAGR